MSTLFLDHPASEACLLVPDKMHAHLFLTLQNEPQSRQFLARFMPLSFQQEEVWLSKANTTTTDAVFVVAQKPSLTAVGSMGLHRIDWKNRRATTGAAILEKYCGQGIGSHAKMLLLSWAFLELGLNKVESRVIAFNGRSKRYSEKCGYVEVGRLKNHHFRNGTYHDEIIMEVHAKEWKKIWRKFQKHGFSVQP